MGLQRQYTTAISSIQKPICCDNNFFSPKISFTYVVFVGCAGQHVIERKVTFNELADGIKIRLGILGIGKAKYYNKSKVSSKAG